MSIRQEHAMGAETLERRPMSLAEFDALPDGLRAEYVDGVALMAPTGSGRHQDAALEMALLLRAALSDVVVRVEPGFEFAWGTRRIPDVAVVLERDDVVWSPQTPVLVVEVLSASTRGEDLFRKTVDYRRAGVAQYWILDRAADTLTVLVDDGGEDWSIGLQLDRDEPVGSVVVGGHGTVGLDLTTLLGDFS